jgi:hypothetical protein
MLKIIAEKPPLPTLWVDTAVGIKLAKVQEGITVQDVERNRVLRLKQLVVKLGRACKLLCPESDQEIEFWGKHLDQPIAREFAHLSRGIRMMPHQAICDAQAFRAMEPYLKGDQEFSIPYRIYFHDDPIQELRTISQQSVFTSVYGLPSLLQELAADLKGGMLQHCEDLRRDNIARHMTYEGQFALEQRSFVNSMVEFARSFRSRLVGGDIKPWEFLAVNGYETYFRRWYRLTNKAADWNGLCTFLVSRYFCELPAIKIAAQLHAKLVTGDRPIESGDSMDVQHLSLAIPVAHFVLTDRKMANRVMELGIDTEWNTKVFSESTIDCLFAELERL